MSTKKSCDDCWRSTADQRATLPSSVTSPRVELAPLPSSVFPRAERRVREEPRRAGNVIFGKERERPIFSEAILRTQCGSVRPSRHLLHGSNQLDAGKWTLLQTLTAKWHKLSGMQRLPSAAAGPADGATRLQDDNIGGRSHEPSRKLYPGRCFCGRAASLPPSCRAMKPVPYGTADYFPRLYVL